MCNEATIQDFIELLLSRKAPLPPNIPLAELLYLDYGQVDSLGLIKFIYEIEDHFQIEFLPEETQSAEFRKVGTLVKMIEKKIAQKSMTQKHV